MLREFNDRYIQHQLIRRVKYLVKVQTEIIQISPPGQISDSEKN